MACGPLLCNVWYFDSCVIFSLRSHLLGTVAGAHVTHGKRACLPTWLAQLIARQLYPHDLACCRARRLLLSSYIFLLLIYHTSIREACHPSFCKKSKLRPNSCSPPLLANVRKSLSACQGSGKHQSQHLEAEWYTTSFSTFTVAGACNGS